MRMIKSIDDNALQTFFRKPQEALDELEDFIENVRIGDTMEYSIVEMTDDEYNKLPEIDK